MAIRKRVSNAFFLVLFAIAAAASADDTPFSRALETEPAKNSVRNEIRASDSEKGPPQGDQVREVPRIERITFVGNQKLTDRELECWCELKGLKPGDASSGEKNQTVAGELLELARWKGYAFAKVELEKGDSDKDREVVFRIDEGPRVIVTKVRFSGNASIPDWVLRLHAECAAQASWLGDCPFQDLTVSCDVSRLRRLYRDRGYLEAEITNHETYSADRSQVQIEFVIDEGVRHKIRHITYRDYGEVSVPAPLNEMKIHEGDYYDQRLVQIDCATIEDRYRQAGELDPEVTSTIRPVGVATEFINLTYEIRSRSPESKERIETATGSVAPALLERANPMQRKIANPPGLRDIDRFVFTGINSFDLAEIRYALSVDFDLVVAAHPDGDPFEYLKTLQKAVVAGYQHRGFPEAAVKVLYNSTLEQVEIDVREGPRFICGEILVNGAGRLSADRLTQLFMKRSESSNASWKNGRPVPFHEVTMRDMRAHWNSAFSEEGYFEPQFDLTIERDPSAGGTAARLLVKIDDEGPRAVLSRIDVSGPKRDRDTDVQTFLAVEPGTPCTRELLDGIKRQLLDSGRYLDVEVSMAEPCGPVIDGCQPHDIKIRLCEYDEARPIAEELSPAEQGLLKLAEWMKRWARGETEEDLVVTATTVIHSGAPTAGNQAHPDRPLPPPELQMAFRMNVRPQSGQTISLVVALPDGRNVLESLFAVDTREIAFASPLRKTKLVLPISFDDRVAFEFSGTVVPIEKRKDGKSPFRLYAGIRRANRSQGNPVRFEVHTNFAAAFLMSLSKLDNPKGTVQDGVIEFSSETMTLRIEQATGRLIEYQAGMLDEDSTFAIRTERNAYATDRQTIDGLLTTCAPSYAAESPWKSIVEFLLDEYLGAADQFETSATVASYHALRKLIGVWNAPGIAEIYHAVQLPTDSEYPFSIPLLSGTPSSGGSSKRGSDWRKRMAAALILPAFKRLVPQQGWMWPVGRDAILLWAGDAPVVESSFRAAPHGTKTGPLGELFLDLADHWEGLDLVRRTACRAGLLRLSTEAFSEDYWPLLSGDSWLGRWFTSLAAAIRSLDESEIQALVLLLPDDGFLPREALASSLALITNDRTRPVDELLPAIFNKVWEEGVRANIKSALLRHTPPAPPSSLPGHPDDDVIPAGAEEEDDDRLVPIEAVPIEPRRLKPAGASPKEFFPDGEPAVDEIPELVP